MPFSVQNALDSYVERQRSVREPDGAFHPSGIFGCARKAIYEVRGTPPSDERDARSNRVLFVGQSFHEIVQQAVREFPGVVQVWTEVPCVNEIPSVKGSADQLVLFDNGKYELQEYKSISSRAFSYGDLPKPDHVKQAMTYLTILRQVGSPGRQSEGNVEPLYSDPIEPLGDALDRVRITYVSKDDLRIEECLVFWSAALQKDIWAYIGELYRYREEGTLPPRLPLVKGKKPWNCNYCQFAKKCWEVDPE